MAYRIKYDIGTAVSIALEVGHDHLGNPIEQEVVFLPGAVLPANLAPRLAQAVDDGEEHVSSLVECLDPVEPAPEKQKPAPVAVTAPPVASNPFVAAGAATYADAKRADLDAELALRQASRDLVVTGTGANGNVVAADIVAALMADDAANAA